MEVLGYSLEVHLHHCRQKGQIPFMATKTFQLSIGRNMFMLPGMSPKLQMFLDGLWFVIFFAWVAALSLTKVLLYRFVKVVKAKTPKITYYSDQARQTETETDTEPYFPKYNERNQDTKRTTTTYLRHPPYMVHGRCIIVIIRDLKSLSCQLNWCRLG